uniref:Putative non-structural protein n=1 Tax=Bombyx mori densovirus TaxID=10809 RepID=VNS1_BMDNV|nr:RecName: Full=Putative non-structural protein; AltName: Full=ORF1 [Bombyx mori densovirus]
MSTQSGGFTRTPGKDGLNPFDEDYVDLVRCMRNRGEHEEYTDLLDNVNTPRELLSAMESFEESSNEIPSQAATGVFAETGNRYDVPRSQDWDTMMKVVSAEEEMIEFLTEEFSAFIQKDCKNNSLEELIETVDEPKLVHSRTCIDEYYLTLILQNKAKETTDLKRPFPVSYQQMELCHKDALNSSERERSLDQFFRAVEPRMGILADQLCRRFENNTVNARRIYTTPLSLDQATDFVKWFTNRGELLIAEVRTLFGSMKQIKERKTTHKTLVEDTHPTTISESYRLDTDTAESQQSSQSESEREEENRRNRPSSSRHINTTRKRKSITTSKGVLTKKKSLKNQPRAISTYFTPADGTIMNAGASGGALTSIQGRIRQSLSTRSTPEHIRNIMFYNTKWPRSLCTSKWPTTEFEYVYRTESVCKESIQPKRHSNNWKRATIRMKVTFRTTVVTPTN